MPERQSEKYYRDTAKYYEIFANRPDEPFFREMVKRYGSPILELASGTGRISLMLAEEGYDVVGIELSSDMLEIAKEKLQKL
ncbi:MAG: class I SAM-dependent methyltransferase, partial [Candidatus Thorarchaeota archaeon]